MLKIDFGVHVGGCIIDSAFTWTRDNTYRPLLDASREAVDTIINHIGVDTMISEIGTLSEEIVYSYEIEENGVLKPKNQLKTFVGILYCHGKYTAENLYRMYATATAPELKKTMS